MYKLLIVDDEFQARNGLRDLVDWGSLGICVVGDAEDGDIALSMLEATQPNILLTDVRMNRMDGLTLAQEARKRLPNIEILFISGYSDADYLRDALRIAAYDYLYKPIRIHELLTLMGNLVKKLDARADAQRQMERSRQLLEKSKPLLTDRLMRSWINGTLQDMETVKARLDLVDLKVPEGTGLIATAFLPEWLSFPSDDQAEAYLVILDDMIRARFGNALLCQEDTEIIALIPSQENALDKGLLHDFLAIVDEMRGVTDAALLIGVSHWHESWMDVPGAVQEAQQAIERRITQEEKVIYHYETEIMTTNMSLSLPEEGLVERFLLTGNFDMLWKSIEESIATYETNRRDLELARKLMMSYALHVDLILVRKGLQGIDSLTFCRQAQAHRPLSSVKGSLHSALSEACKRVLRQQETTFSASVAQVYEIIRTRYPQRLNLDILAEEAHYSQAHLSTLFRQETGITIGEALYRARLSASMEKLGSTRESVSLIAQQCGYTDVQYFSRVFKRHTGLTPLEYRKRVSQC